MIKDTKFTHCNLCGKDNASSIELRPICHECLNENKISFLAIKKQENERCEKIAKNCQIKDSEGNILQLTIQEEYVRQEIANSIKASLSHDEKK